MNEFFKPIKKMGTPKKNNVTGAAASAAKSNQEPVKKNAFPWTPIADAKFTFDDKHKVYDKAQTVLISDDKVGVTLGYAVKYSMGLNQAFPIPAIKKGDVKYFSTDGRKLENVTGFFELPEKYTPAKS